MADSPIHVLLHILEKGGVPAGVGLAAGLFLGWPQEDAPTGTATNFEQLVHNYHNQLGGSGMTMEHAFGVMVALAIVLSFAGLLVNLLFGSD